MMRVLIAAGGTGGHILPAIALAQQIHKKEKGDVLFILSSRAQDRLLVKGKDMPFKIIGIDSLKSKSIFSILSFSVKLIIGTMHSLFIILTFRPYVIIGFGGYVSGPLVLLGSILRIKTIIHEQNVYPGLANRILAHVADTIAISFEETKQYLKKFEHKIIVTGNPLRSGLKKGGKAPASQENFTMLVIGGSQGAHFLNTLIPQAIELLGDRKKNLRIRHIAGHKEKDDVENSYKRFGVEHEVFSFTEEMSRLYNECDFVIARAGAMTVSELWHLGIPGILIPYPYAGGHQSLNAKVLEKIGGAIVLEQGSTAPQDMHDAMRKLMNRDILNDMHSNLKGTERPDACEVLIEAIYSSSPVGQV